MKIPTGGTARKPLAREARFGVIPKPTVKKAVAFAVWMGKGASMEGSTDSFYQRFLGTIYVPPEKKFRRHFILANCVVLHANASLRK